MTWNLDGKHHLLMSCHGWLYLEIHKRDASALRTLTIVSQSGASNQTRFPSGFTGSMASSKPTWTSADRRAYAIPNCDSMYGDFARRCSTGEDRKVCLLAYRGSLGERATARCRGCQQPEDSLQMSGVTNGQFSEAANVSF